MSVIGSHYDYANQAWTVDGRYVACNHPASMACNCYGKQHAGELAPAENLPTAMTYLQVESAINDMMVARKATGLTQARMVADFSVKLYATGLFVVGANLSSTESGMDTAKWIHSHLD